MIVTTAPSGSRRVSSNAIFTGDFTVEMWIKNTGGGNVSPSGGTADRIIDSNAWRLVQTNTLENSYILGGFFATPQYVISANTGWHHIALCRSGSTVRLFRDGVVLVTLTSSASADFSQIRFGTNSGPTGTSPYLVDEIRIIGAARYTAPFTPPTTAFPSFM